VLFFLSPSYNNYNFLDAKLASFKKLIHFTFNPLPVFKVLKYTTGSWSGILCNSLDEMTVHYRPFPAFGRFLQPVIFARYSWMLETHYHTGLQVRWSGFKLSPQGHCEDIVQLICLLNLFWNHCSGYSYNLIGSQLYTLFTNHTIFCSTCKLHIFLSQWKWVSKWNI